MSRVFFTSDHHFGHKSIIGHCNRPFADVEEMNEVMVERWNDAVGPLDLVYHLGDFSYKLPAGGVGDIASRLNGRIWFIPGNHDAETLKAWRQARLMNWRLCQLYEEIEVEDQRIVLCHYAFRTWHHDLRGVWHLYGHSHNELPPLGKSVDVGVDRWNFAPVSFDELKVFMDAQPIHDAPQFANYVPEAVDRR